MKQHAIVNSAHLYRGEPEGEVPSSVLDQDAKEPLYAAKDGSVQHDWLLLSAIRGNVLKLEALRQVEVALHCAALPEPPNGVLDLQVNLYECARARDRENHFY